jgi:hypothetical protein
MPILKTWIGSATAAAGTFPIANSIGAEAADDKRGASTVVARMTPSIG